MAGAKERQIKKTMKEQYDRMTRVRSIMLGDQVMVLQPSESQELLAKWQSKICMHDKQKKNRLFFHVRVDISWSSVFDAK